VGSSRALTTVRCTWRSVRWRRCSLGGAAAVSGRLPDHVGAELLRAARQAFGQSFELTAGINAVLAIATAILTAALLRAVRRTDEP